jgi:hypothetical protein
MVAQAIRQPSIGGGPQGLDWSAGRRTRLLAREVADGGQTGVGSEWLARLERPVACLGQSPRPGSAG